LYRQNSGHIVEGTLLPISILASLMHCRGDSVGISVLGMLAVLVLVLLVLVRTLAFSV
jgi:hypothetical protein